MLFRPTSSSDWYNLRQVHDQFTYLSVFNTLRLLNATQARLRKLNADALGDFRKDMREGSGSMAPVTRINKRTSTSRVLEKFSTPIWRISRIRAGLHETTLNDSFTAVAAGAACKHLKSKSELPNSSLDASMLTALRSDGSAGGNQVANILVRLCSKVANPVERVKAVHRKAGAHEVSGLRLRGSLPVPLLYSPASSRPLPTIPNNLRPTFRHANLDTEYSGGHDTPENLRQVFTGLSNFAIQQVMAPTPIEKEQNGWGMSTLYKIFSYRVKLHNDQQMKESLCI